MYSGIIDCMYSVNARERCGNHRLCDFVDKLAKERIFLRRAPDDRERENGVLFAENFFDLHARKIVLAGVVTDVVAKGTFRF